MVEMFGATIAQAGKINEDAFLIARGVPLFAALCDGAGNAGALEELTDVGD